MSKDFDDKFYQEYPEDYDLPLYGIYDPHLSIFDIPTENYKIDNENISIDISNKPIFPEKIYNQNATLQEQKISLEKENKKNTPNLNEQKIFLETNLNENKEEKQKTKEKTFLSNKTKKSSSEKENEIDNENTNENKFKDATLRIKCNNILLKVLLNFINNKIKELYNNNIGKGILKKQFHPLKKLESNIRFNQALLNRTLKDIFSDNIYGKITTYPKDYNKRLIEILLNEKNCIIQDYFKKLFSLTFVQCVEHYRGTKFYDELNGMRLFEEEESIKKDIELYENINYYFKNYEIIINNKRSRKSRRKLLL